MGRSEGGQPLPVSNLHPVCKATLIPSGSRLLRNRPASSYTTGVRNRNAPVVRSWDGAIPQAGTSFGAVFFSRRRSGPDPLVRVRLATLVVGGVLGLVGMRLDDSLLVSVAIGVVLVGFLLRLAPKTDAKGDANDPSD